MILPVALYLGRKGGIDPCRVLPLDGGVGGGGGGGGTNRSYRGYFWRGQRQGEVLP